MRCPTRLPGPVTELGLKKTAELTCGLHCHPGHPASCSGYRPANARTTPLDGAAASAPLDQSLGEQYTSEKNSTL